MNGARTARVDAVRSAVGNRSSSSSSSSRSSSSNEARDLPTRSAAAGPPDSGPMVPPAAAATAESATPLAPGFQCAAAAQSVGSNGQAGLLAGLDLVACGPLIRPVLASLNELVKRDIAAAIASSASGGANNCGGTGNSSVSTARLGASVGERRRVQELRHRALIECELLFVQLHSLHESIR
eukprot:GHVU01047914.1.p1 GENE.GHVU01047914.1~~GHVU01047914.1.p1  ORF type:complete len:182 (+),score=24.81 GHVU01047914.1:11-556(+)